MNSIDILQKNYNDLRTITKTNGIQVNDTLFIENNVCLITGKTTILDSTPVIKNITDGALYIADKFYSENGMIINYGITNQNNNTNVSSKFTRCKVDDLYIDNNSIFNILNISNYIYCKTININKNLEGNNINGEDLYLKNNKLFIDKCNIIYGNIYNDIIIDDVILDNIYLKNSYGNFFSNTIVSNNFININNVELKNKIDIANLILKDDLVLELSDTNMITNGFIVNNFVKFEGNIFEFNSINSNIITNNVYITKETYCGNLYINNFEFRYENNNIPICINQNKSLTITTTNIYFYGYEYNNSFSFCLKNNINFQNLTSNFNLLTIFFDEQLSDIVKYKPEKKFNVLVSGFRTFGSNIYSIIYNIDFFNLNDKQINISIVYDENNQISFINNYIYNINKFNFNYII
jgi:hypothetical protein